MKQEILDTLSTLTIRDLEWANEWATEVQDEDGYNIKDFYWAILDSVLWDTYDNQLDIVIEFYDDPDVIAKIESMCKELNYAL